jgi:predicted nucleotidyltransferase
MNREIYEKLKELKPILRERYGIEEFALFGSMAKGTDTEESDVDIVILRSSKKNFFLRMKAIEFLKEHLRRDVDMGHFDSMRTFIKDRIAKDLVVV